MYKLILIILSEWRFCSGVVSVNNRFYVTFKVTSSKYDAYIPNEPGIIWDKQHIQNKKYLPCLCILHDGEV